MKVIARLPEGPLCRTFYKTEPAFFQGCVQCGRFERLHHHHGPCERCARPRVLHALLAEPDGIMRAELEPVSDALVSNDPARLLVWLREPGPRSVVSALATSTRPVTYDLLDTLFPIKAARYLRAILVTAGVLPY